MISDFIPTMKSKIDQDKNKEKLIQVCLILLKNKTLLENQ